MTIDLSDSLAQRLAEIARGKSLSTAELVERVLTQFASSIDHESAAWVAQTQNLLGNVWPREDFSAWSPPHETQTR